MRHRNISYWLLLTRVDDHVEMDMQPTFRHLTSPDYGKLKDKQHEVRKESASFFFYPLVIILTCLAFF